MEPIPPPPKPSATTLKPFPSGPDHSPAQARMWFNLILPILQPLVGSMAELTGIGHPIGAMAASHATPLLPPAYAFLIWLPIFGLAIAWGIWQALPAGRDSALAHRLGWPLAIAFGLNILWMLLAQLTGMGWHLVVVILGALAAAVIAFLVFVRNPGAGGIGQTIAAPLVGLLAGWLSIAAFVNVAGAARASALIVDGAAGSFTAVLLLLAAGGFATAIVALVRSAFWYVAAVAWGLAAVTLGNFGMRDWDIAPGLTAGTMVALVVAVHVMRGKREAEVKPPS